MEQIILEHTVVLKLNALVDILIDKEYFSYLENAETYVHKLYDFIYTIPSQPRRRTRHPATAFTTAATKLIPKPPTT